MYDTFQKSDLAIPFHSSGSSDLPFEDKEKCTLCVWKGSSNLILPRKYIEQYPHERDMVPSLYVEFHANGKGVEKATQSNIFWKSVLQKSNRTSCNVHAL